MITHYESGEFEIKLPPNKRELYLKQQLAKLRELGIELNNKNEVEEN
jgi:hypothetical protein